MTYDQKNLTYDRQIEKNWFLDAKHTTLSKSLLSETKGRKRQTALCQVLPWTYTYLAEIQGEKLCCLLTIWYSSIFLVGVVPIRGEGLI